MKLEFSGRIFENYLSIEFHEKSTQWEPSCSMRADRNTDMTKLMVAFRKFENAPKQPCCYVLLITGCVLIIFLQAGTFTCIGYNVLLYGKKCNDFVKCRIIRGFYIVRLLPILILLAYRPKITLVAGRHKHFAGEYWLMRCFAIYNQSNWIKVCEVLRLCNTSGRCLVCIHHISWKTWMEKTTWRHAHIRINMG